MIAVSNLVFPDITPPLDLEAVRKTLPQQFQQGRHNLMLPRTSINSEAYETDNDVRKFRKLLKVV